jgi:hypothetical protein
MKNKREFTATITLPVVVTFVLDRSGRPDYAEGAEIVLDKGTSRIPITDAAVVEYLAGTDEMSDEISEWDADNFPCRECDLPGEEPRR